MEAKGRFKRRVLTSLALLAVGFPPFINSFDNPHLKGLRGRDVLQLLVIGLCVGLALGMFVGSRDSS